MFNPSEHLMNLKGKQYLQVMWRLVWFREALPFWCIDTHLEKLDESHAVFSAKIYDEDGVLKASGYGSESIKDFRDFIEKAETKAIGRALAMLGYGTQFAPELDEEERIVDSPVAMPIKEVPPVICDRCGDPLANIIKRNGEVWEVPDIVKYSKRKFNGVYCKDCMKIAQQVQDGNGG